MRPIEYRSDVTFSQALRCVEYRLPKRDGLRARPYLATVGMRYGLMGAAAAHHLLVSTSIPEEPFVFESIIAWPKMVSEHVSLELSGRIPVDELSSSVPTLGKLAKRPIEISVPLHRRFYSLNICLRAAIEDFTAEFECLICDGCHIWSRRKAIQRFTAEARESMRYAMNFFERQQLGLEEVPEIALLDE